MYTSAAISRWWYAERRIPQDGEQRAERDRRQVQLGRRRQLVAPLVHLAAAAASRRRRPDERAAAALAAAAAAAAAAATWRLAAVGGAAADAEIVASAVPLAAESAAAVDVGGSPSDAFATRLAARVMAARY